MRNSKNDQHQQYKYKIRRINIVQGKTYLVCTSKNIILWRYLVFSHLFFRPYYKEPWAIAILPQSEDHVILGYNNENKISVFSNSSWLYKNDNWPSASFLSSYFYNIMQWIRDQRKVNRELWEMIAKGRITKATIERHQSGVAECSQWLLSKQRHSIQLLMIQ